MQSSNLHEFYWLKYHAVIHWMYINVLVSCRLCSIWSNMCMVYVPVPQTVCKLGSASAVCVFWLHVFCPNIGKRSLTATFPSTPSSHGWLSQTSYGPRQPTGEYSPVFHTQIWCLSCQQTSRLHGDLNPCLQPDTSQVNCTAEQPIDPNSIDDPLSHHILQDEILMDGLLGSASNQPHSFSSHTNLPFASSHISKLSDPPQSTPYPPSNPPPCSRPDPSVYSKAHSSSSQIYTWASASYSSPHSFSYANPTFTPSYINESSNPPRSTSYPSPNPPLYPLPSPSAYPETRSSSSQTYTQSSIPRFDQPHDYGTAHMHRLSVQVPHAASHSACAAPYVLPGMHFVPAYAPLHPNEQVHSEVITAGVFHVSEHLTL